MRTLSFLLALAQSPPEFRSETALVHVDVEVTRDGAPVDGLTAADLRVSDNGKIQPIVNFSHGEEQLDVILLLDTSDSMRITVERVAGATTRALQVLRPGDRVAVVTFDCSTTWVADFMTNFGAAAIVVAEVLNRPFPSCSRIQQALAEASAPYREQGPSSGRRAIVLITDDQGSDTYAGAAKQVWEAGAVAMAVVVRNPGPRNSRYRPDYKGARDIVVQTGGDMIETPDPGEGLVQMFQRLRSRYSLHYRMPEGKPGSERKIKVELSPEAARLHSRAVVRARTGYVIPAR